MRKCAVFPAGFAAGAAQQNATYSYRCPPAGYCVDVEFVPGLSIRFVIRTVFPGVDNWSRAPLNI